MNNAPDPRTRLLAESLQGEWSSGPAAAMARRAAAHARRRRAVRGALTAVTAAAVVAALLVIARRPNATLPIASAPVTNARYEIISDDELVSLLRDRPLLVLPQENGAKRIVLLDR